MDGWQIYFSLYGERSNSVIIWRKETVTSTYTVQVDGNRRRKKRWEKRRSTNSCFIFLVEQTECFFQGWKKRKYLRIRKSKKETNTKRKEAWRGGKLFRSISTQLWMHGSSCNKVINANFQTVIGKLGTAAVEKVIWWSSNLIFARESVRFLLIDFICVWFLECTMPQSLFLFNC